MTIGLVLFILSIIMMSTGTISAIYGFAATHFAESTALAAAFPSGILIAGGMALVLLGAVLLIILHSNDIYKITGKNKTGSSQHHTRSSSPQVPSGT